MVWPLVINALNIAFVYSWRVFQKSYCRQIVGILIRHAHPEIISVHSRPAKNFRIPDEICFDGVGHYPISCSVRRCVLCEKNSRKACEKCKLTLHLNTCFQMFYEQSICKAYNRLFSLFWHILHLLSVDFITFDEF